MPTSAEPSSALSCASSGRALRLSAARHFQRETPGPLGAQPLPRVLQCAASPPQSPSRTACDPAGTALGAANPELQALMEQYATAGVLTAHVWHGPNGPGKRNEVSKMQNYTNAKLHLKTGISNNMTLTKHYKNQAPSPPASPHAPLRPPASTHTSRTSTPRTKAAQPPCLDVAELELLDAWRRLAVGGVGRLAVRIRVHSTDSAHPATRADIRLASRLRVTCNIARRSTLWGVPFSTAPENWGRFVVPLSAASEVVAALLLTKHAAQQVVDSRLDDDSQHHPAGESEGQASSRD